MINRKRMSMGMCKKACAQVCFVNQTTRNANDDDDDNVDHAKKGRKVGREAMIPNDTVM